MRINSEFIPKTFICLREGYSWKRFQKDLIAGITIGFISLPLAMAFAIGSGVAPVQGLYTAIIAGFLISFLGGSRVQIGGPTGAFVVIVYDVVMRHGYDGLCIATLIAGILLILFGLFRAGQLLKFIPFSVTVGFTAGIALSIFSSQIKDFFGLSMGNVPIGFIDKWKAYAAHFSVFSYESLTLSLFTLAVLIGMKKLLPKIPGAIAAVILTTLIVYLFDLPVETIHKKFGPLPDSLPFPTLPSFSWDKVIEVFPSAITIAMLGAIESLLSAVIADNMTGYSHRPNCELIAQGIGNIGSILFSGIPATGAIARTGANVKLGATSPFSGMIHALTVLIILYFFAPLACKIPLACLAAILVYVAWNMSEKDQILQIMKGPKSDIFVLIITFLLTVLVDITVAVYMGVLLSCVLFLKRMTDHTQFKMNQLTLEDSHHPENEPIEIPQDWTVCSLDGPFFFGVSGQLIEQLHLLNPLPKVFILRMNRVPLADASGVKALKVFQEKCKEKGILFCMTGLTPKLAHFFERTSVVEAVGRDNIYPTLYEAKESLLERTRS